MSAPCLEYTVDVNGRVDTAGLYRLIDEAEWDSLPPRTLRRTSGLYAKVMAEVCAGRIVALSAQSTKAGWHIARTLRSIAQRMDVPIEVKRSFDPDDQCCEVVMVRKQQEAGRGADGLSP